MGWFDLQRLEPRVMMSVASEADVYDRWLVVEPGASTDVQASVAVLESELQAMTGVDFTVTAAKTTGRGIFLLRSAADLTTRYPELASQATDLATLATRDTEGFFIYSSGSDNLYIVGNTDSAVDLGVFYYLQELGWRQLMPGDNWRIVPHRDSIRITIDSVQEPDFRLRAAVASGGFYVNLPLDMDAKLASDYAFWQRATLQGGSIKAAGHMGEVFNETYRGLLQDNYDTYIGQPNNDDDMMMAYYNGTWQWDLYKWPTDDGPPYDPNTPTSSDYTGIKMNPSCPALVDLFVQDRVQAYKDLLSQYGTEDNRSWAVSVEPADGVKYDENPTTLANFPTVSDQVLYLAKKAADALRADPDPDVQAGNVTLLAYGAHSMVPEGTNVFGENIVAWLADPDSNVYTFVVPYSYTHAYTPMGGDQLLEAWANATAAGHRGIYDYWNIPGWSMGEPTEDIAQNAQRIQTWWDLGYDGFQGECGIGASVGSQMYMATQMMWDMSTDPVAARDEFYNLSFGAAEEPMKRMIERWGSGNRFSYTPQELGQSFVDLAEARTLAANDPASLARVDDYVQYVQYLRTYYEYINARKHGASDAVRHDLAEAAFKAMWQNHDAGIMNTWLISRILRTDEIDNATSGTSTHTLAEDWDLADPDAWGWEWVRDHPLTTQDIEGFVADGVADYGMAGATHAIIDRPVFSDTLEALTPMSLDANVVQTPMFYGNEHYFQFVVPTGVSSLNFRIQTAAVYGNTQWPAHVTVTDSSQTVVFEDDFGGDSDGGNGTWLSFSVTGLTAGQTYTMEVVDRKHGFALEVPEKLPFALTGNLTSVYTTTPSAWNAYFYVPAGTDKVAFFPDYAGSPYIVVKDGDGNTVSPSYGDGSGETDYTVATGHDAEVWSVSNLNIYHQPLKPFSTPNVWSFSPYGMLAPVNAAPSVYSGGDQTIVSPTNQTSLDASMVDDGISGSAVTTLWTKQSGPGTVSFGNASLVDTTVTFGATGTYVLRLTATDSDGAAAYDEITINYLPSAANVAPTVNAGNDASVAMSGSTATASLDGTVTDIGTLTYKWTKVEGPGTVYFAAPTGVDTTATFDAVGTYVLRLAAKDAGGLEAFDEVTVTITPDYVTGVVYKQGDTGTFGFTENFDNKSQGHVFADIDPAVGVASPSLDRFSTRFRATATVTVDRVLQRLYNVDPNTRFEIGIMADDGAGNPSGTYLVSTGAGYNPADGDSSAWAIFTSSVQLNAGQLYHIVTRMTAVGDGESCDIRQSQSNVTIRPYDRASDPDMSTLEYYDTNTDPLVTSYAWRQIAHDPFFALANGSTLITGMGQPYVQSLDTRLQTQGGATGKALGQKFTISTREVAATDRVLMTGLTIMVQKTGAPGDLIVKVRDVDGTVLATITKAASSIAATMTEYTWTFDGGNTVMLTPGQAFFITTEMGSLGTTSDYYKFRSTNTAAGLETLSYGGTTASVPIQSAAGSTLWTGYNWASPTLYPSRTGDELYFRFSGQVVAAPVYESGTGTFGLSETFTNTGGAITLNTTAKMHSARFKAMETVTVDRVMQKFTSVDAALRLEVGIMADNGNGQPDGRFLVSTGVFNPADTTSEEWAVFTQSYTLQAGEIYHLVTRVVAAGTGVIQRSVGNTAIRPYDRASDTEMTVLTTTDNGATWTVGSFDPYFTLGNGASIVQGPGQPYQNSANNRLNTQGGTGKAMGQKFTIFTSELSPNAKITVNSMNFTVYKGGTPTASLVLKLRDAAGNVLATITKAASEIATTSTQYSWTFDGGASVTLYAGQTYFITSEISGTSTTGHYYYFRAAYSASGNATATWGGTTACVPIQSAASNSWTSYNWTSPTLYPNRSDSDLWFSFNGALSSGESLMATSQGGTTAPQPTTVAQTPRSRGTLRSTAKPLTLVLDAPAMEPTVEIATSAPGDSRAVLTSTASVRRMTHTAQPEESESSLNRWLAQRRNRRLSLRSLGGSSE